MTNRENKYLKNFRKYSKGAKIADLIKFKKVSLKTTKNGVKNVFMVYF